MRNAGRLKLEYYPLPLSEAQRLRDQLAFPGELTACTRHSPGCDIVAGVGSSVIALWLGYQSVETTQIYLDANLALKKDALKKTSPINTAVGRFKPDDQLLSFLRNL